MSCGGTGPLAPRAVVRTRPLQHHKVTAPRGGATRSTRPTGSLAPAPTSALPGSRWQRLFSTVRLVPRAELLPRPPQVELPAAYAHISVLSHGQPYSLDHFNTSRCPPCAASAQQSVEPSYGMTSSHGLSWGRGPICVRGSKVVRKRSSGGEPRAKRGTLPATDMSIRGRERYSACPKNPTQIGSFPKSSKKHLRDRWLFR